MIFIELPQNSNAWLAWRRSGLGASEIAAVMGASPWASALELWEQKTGRRRRWPT